MKRRIKTNNNIIQAVRRTELWCHLNRPQFTSSGYGKKIPTPYMLQIYDKRWRRVYAVVNDNHSNLYISSQNDFNLTHDKIALAIQSFIRSENKWKSINGGSHE